MNKEKVIIYPVNDEVRAFIEFSEIRTDIEVKKCCVPQSWYAYGKTISFGSNRIVEIEAIEESIANLEVESIIVLNNIVGFDFNILICPYLQSIEEFNKKLHFAVPLNEQETKILDTAGIQFDVFASRVSDMKIEVSDKRILKIATPIVAVLGMFEYTDKSDTVLYVHNYLKRKGYNVKTVLTQNNMLGFPDCYSFPSEMLNNNYTEAEKIIYFNHYIRKIEIKEKPDVIVIGIPGEIMALDERHNGNFGIMPFLIGNAVNCDYAILNVFANFSSKEFVEQLNSACRDKYLIDINAVVVSKMVLDVTTINTEKLKVYYIEHPVMDIDERFFYERKNKNGISLGSDILETLSGYGSYSKI